MINWAEHEERKSEDRDAPKKDEGKDKANLSENDKCDEDRNLQNNYCMISVEEYIRLLASDIIFDIRQKLEDLTLSEISKTATSIDEIYRDSRYSPRDLNQNLSRYERSGSETETAVEQTPSTSKAQVNIEAMQSAFNVVRELLARLAELLKAFCNRFNDRDNQLADFETECYASNYNATERERKSSSFCEQRWNTEYDQNLYRIASFILEMIGEQLSDLSSIMSFASTYAIPLDLLKSPRPSLRRNPEHIWSIPSFETQTKIGVDAASNVDDFSGGLDSSSSAPKKEDSAGSSKSRDDVKKKDKSKVKKSMTDAINFLGDMVSNLYCALTDYDIYERSSKEKDEKSPSSTAGEHTKIPSSRSASQKSQKIELPGKVIRETEQNTKYKVIKETMPERFCAAADTYYPENVSPGSFGNFLEEGKPSTGEKRPMSDKYSDETPLIDEKILSRRAYSYPSGTEEYLSLMRNKNIPKSPSTKTQISHQEFLTDITELRDVMVQTREVENITSGTRASRSFKPSADQIRQCANAIIDNLLIIETFTSDSWESLNQKSYLTCSECNQIILIDVGKEATESMRGSLDFDSLLYYVDTEGEKTGIPMGFYLLPTESKSTRSSIKDAIAARKANLRKISSALKQSTSEPHLEHNILTLDITEFTRCIKNKFSNMIEESIVSAGNEMVDLENEKVILNILLDCFKQTSDFMKRENGKHTKELKINKSPSSKRTDIASEGSSSSTSTHTECETLGILEECLKFISDNVIRGKRCLTDSSDKNELQNMREEYCFENCGASDPVESKTFIYQEQMNVAESETKSPKTDMRSQHEVEKVVGGEARKPSSIDFEFSFSEVEASLRHLWEEFQDRDNQFYFDDPYPHTLIDHQDKLPPNVLEVRDVVDGAVEVKLEAWSEECESSKESHVIEWSKRLCLTVKECKTNWESESHQISVQQPRSPRRVSEPAKLPRSANPEADNLFSIEDPKQELQAQLPLDKISCESKVQQLRQEIRKAGYGTGPPLILKIHRKTAVTDSMMALMKPSSHPLGYYRDVRISFKSIDEQEETQENSQELFEILSHQLFSHFHYQLFEHPTEVSRFLYINPSSPSGAEWFRFAGVILALSLMHQKPLSVNLSQAFFKCFLDRRMAISDIKELNSSLYKKITWLQNNKVSSYNTRMNFTVKDKYCGVIHDIELIPEGRKVPVTDVNKSIYIKKVMKWTLLERCFFQMREFRRGFLLVLNPSVLSFLTVSELKQITQMISENFHLQKAYLQRKSV